MHQHLRTQGAHILVPSPLRDTVIGQSTPSGGHFERMSGGVILLVVRGAGPLCLGVFLLTAATTFVVGAFGCVCTLRCHIAFRSDIPFRCGDTSLPVRLVSTALGAITVDTDSSNRSLAEVLLAG